MKRFIQTTLFILFMTTMTIYSRAISERVVDSCNNCIEFLANNTVGTQTILGI